MHISFVVLSPGSVETDVGWGGTWTAIWWPVVSGQEYLCQKSSKSINRP